MTGSDALALLRQSLRDDERLYRQGSFWSDAEIYRALNNAQYHIVGTALSQKSKHWLLRNLVSTLNIGAQAVLPDDYLDALTVQIDGKLAQLYIGAEAMAFFGTSHAAAFIIADTIYCRNRGAAPTTAVLHYYRKPEPIVATTDLTDLPESGIDIIIDFAAILLGFKESVKPREAKLSQRSRAFASTMASTSYIQTAKGVENAAQA